MGYKEVPKPKFQPWTNPEKLKSMTGRTPEEDTELSTWRKWSASPNDNTSKEVLDLMKPTIDSALNTYAPDHKDDLRPRAEIIAMQSLQRFDPTKGVKPSTHVFNNLKTLSRVVAERYHVVHVPENVRNDQRALHFESQKLMDELGREPTVQELADKVKLSPRRIEKLRNRASVDFSESSSLSEKGDTLFAKSSDPYKMWSDYVYMELDPTNKKIFEWSTGYGGSETLSKGEIAKRLKMSSPAVSQRVNTIVKKLEEGYELS